MSATQARTLRGPVSILILIVLAVTVCPAQAQSSGATVGRLGFMAGHWTRTTDGMYVEQVFLPPTGGTIVGMQRRTRGDTTLVSYFFIIERAKDGIVCRFKHFENDYTTYEDRNNTGPRTFWLIESSPNAATFEERTPDGRLHLRYRITEEGQLGIAVGSPDDFESHTFTESLHDPIR